VLRRVPLAPHGREEGSGKKQGKARESEGKLGESWGKVGGEQRRYPLMQQNPPRRIIPGEPPEHRRLLRRTMLWIILGVCAALLAAIIGEAIARDNAEARVAATRARIQTLRQTIATTQHAIAVAQSDDQIERQARRWGYIRSGDHPVIIVTPGTR